jgi:hypothetical protein
MIWISSNWHSSETNVEYILPVGSFHLVSVMTETSLLQVCLLNVMYCNIADVKEQYLCLRFCMKSGKIFKSPSGNETSSHSRTFE